MARWRRSSRETQGSSPSTPRRSEADRLARPRFPRRPFRCKGRRGRTADTCPGQVSRLMMDDDDVTLELRKREGALPVTEFPLLESVQDAVTAARRQIHHTKKEIG